MNPDDPHADGFYVSTDRKLIDPAFVIKAITTSYWGGWRTPIVILRSMDHSLCFGLYEHNVADPLDRETKRDRQIGFARVVTDYTTFAWICDVIMDKEYRNKKLGAFLMRTVMAHPDVAPRACMLTTKDAQKFYQKHGFESFVAMKRLPEQKS